MRDVLVAVAVSAGIVGGMCGIFAVMGVGMDGWPWRRTSFVPPALNIADKLFVLAAASLVSLCALVSVGLWIAP